MTPFLEKLLQLLAQGSFSSTYKHAVLLALIDLCVESGHPPSSVTTTQLARRVLELYWPQVRPFATGQVLRQNRGKPASILRLIQGFREARPDLHAPALAARGAPEPFARLLEAVEWVLVEYPLPRLQRVGSSEERFLVVIGWGEDVSKADFLRARRGRGGDFDNTIRFVAGASEALVALSAVLRPLIQQQWMGMVRQINRLPESELEGFLFGASRQRLGALRRPLLEQQGGRCFYCQDALTEARGQVDHFIPWSRHPDDGLDNLVLAHEVCNRVKGPFLAHLDHALAWRRRSTDQGDHLDAIAETTGWPRDRGRSFGVAAGLYRGVVEGMRLWHTQQGLLRVEAEALPALARFGQGLLDGRPMPPEAA